MMSLLYQFAKDRLKRTAAVVGFAFSLALSLSVIGMVMATSADAAALSYGFPTQDTELSAGMAASTVAEQNDESVSPVERAASNQLDKYVGVVTSVEQPIAGQPTQVFVTKTGQTEVYVSDLNGAIAKGDFLVLSPLLGILMKAPADARVVLGTALADFDAATGEETQITTVEGSTEPVEIATVLANLNVQTREVQSPSFLSGIGAAVAGKEVSHVRVLTATLILTILLVIEGAIIYGAVHSSIVALGRNPLSRGAVYKELINVSLLVLVVLAAGVGAAYLILWI